VPSDLRGAHRFVTATRDAAVGRRAAEDGRISVGPRAGVVHMVLSRELLRRALLIAQAVVGEAERRGWGVTSDRGAGVHGPHGVAVVVGGHAYPIEIHEVTETVPFTDEEVRAWRAEDRWDLYHRQDKLPPPQRKRKRATGRLKLVAPTGYGGGRAVWSEGPRGPLENKLASLFETLEARAVADDAAAIERARRAEALRRERAERAERARRARIEDARAKRLAAEVAAWRGATEIRAYVMALRGRLPSLPGEERDRMGPWCRWAARWADRTDPTCYPAELVVGLDDERDDRGW
jgi:hypothetical protein